MPVKKKAVPKKPQQPLDEFEKVVKWRFEELLALGLSADQAIGLIETPDVVHAAQKLVEAGCPLAIVVTLLEGG